MNRPIRSIRGPLLTPHGDGVRALPDAWLAWDERGVIHQLRPALDRDRPDLDVRGVGLIVPGFVDAHVHLPQYRVRGRFDGALLPWLREFIWPEEERFTDPERVRSETRTFVEALAAAGTTCAAVYGSPHPASVEPLLSRDGAGPYTVAGPALMDREGPDGLLLGAAEADAAMRRLWGRFGERLAVTPRFAVSCSRELLAACGALAQEQRLRVQTHLSENPDEIALVAERFPEARDYLDVYERAGLVGPRTLLAHVVHASDDALSRIAAAGATVVHCPTSNVALGSGRMPVERVTAAGVHVCLGSDVGAGPDLCLLDVMRCFMEQHADHHPTDAATTLPLATSAGALALGLPDRGKLAHGLRADVTVLAALGADADPVGAFEQRVKGYVTGESGAVLGTVVGGERVFWVFGG